MNDEPFHSPNIKEPPSREAKPGELLFEFARASDKARMFCELRLEIVPSMAKELVFSRAARLALTCV